MKNFLVLQAIIFLHLNLIEMNAQTGWYQQVSGTEQILYGIHFSDANTGVVVGTSGTILRTTNGGKTWAAQNSGTNSHFFDVTFFNSDTGIVVGIGGTIFRTTNGGETWNSHTSGIIPAIFSVYFSDENIGTAVGHTGIMLRTTDGGITWIQQPDAPTSLRAVQFMDVNKGIAVGDNGLVMCTTDGGANWFVQPSGIQINLHGVYFTDTNTGTVVGGSNLTGARIYKTTDGGINWMLQHSIPNEALLDVHFSDSRTGTAVGWNGIILSTTDGGATWISQNSSTTTSLISVFFVNSDIGFAVGGVGTILATMDGGIPVELISFTSGENGNRVRLNWITGSEINNSGFEIERRDPLRGGKNGSWEKIGFVDGNGTTTEKHSYSFIDKNLSAGIYFYRLKQIDFDGSYDYSEIMEVKVDNMPYQFSLKQNYPNPFNPVTNFEYQIAKPGFVNLKIFNAIGDEVETLVNEVKDPGSYKIKYDANHLASGIYYYRFSADGFTDTKKFILLK